MWYSRHYRLRYHRYRSFFDKVVLFKGTVDSKTTWIGLAPSGAQTDRLLNAHSLFGEDRRVLLHSLHVTPPHRHGCRCALRMRNKAVVSGNCRLGNYLSLKCYHDVNVKNGFKHGNKKVNLTFVLMMINHAINIVDISKRMLSLYIKTTIPTGHLVQLKRHTFFLL